MPKPLLLGLGLCLTSLTLHAGWFDTITEELEKSEILKQPADKPAAATGGTELSSADMNGALKEALRIGTKAAIGQLGVEDGYFGNELVKIPVPENVQLVATTLQNVGMGHYVDDFVLSLNRAAEKAVPETAVVLGDAITQMSIADAQKILGGPDDAATEYFRTTSGTALNAAVLPIVQEFTEQTEVTRYYKTMMGAYDEYAAPMVNESGLGGLVSSFTGGGTSGDDKAVDYDPRDLDAYVTAKSLDGLYSVLAEEEKKIREQPAARTTELLQKVFSQF